MQPCLSCFHVITYCRFFFLPDSYVAGAHCNFRNKTWRSVSCEKSILNVAAWQMQLISSAFKNELSRCLSLPLSASFVLNKYLFWRINPEESWLFPFSKAFLCSGWGTRYVESELFKNWILKTEDDEDCLVCCCRYTCDLIWIMVRLLFKNANSHLCYLLGSSVKQPVFLYVLGAIRV